MSAEELIRLNQLLRDYNAFTGCYFIHNRKMLKALVSPAMGILASAIMNDPSKASLYCGKLEHSTANAPSALRRVVFVSDRSSVLSYGLQSSGVMMAVAEAKRTAALCLSGAEYDILLIDSNDGLWRQYSAAKREYEDERTTDGRKSELGKLLVELQSQIVGNIVKAIEDLREKYGDIAVMLEDIAGPACFDVEEKLNAMGIPAFHDDQHGLAIACCAAVLNACRHTHNDLRDAKIVILGAGAAAGATARTLDYLRGWRKGQGRIIMFDSLGKITMKRAARGGFLPTEKNKLELAKLLDPRGEEEEETLEEALKGADIFISLAKPAAPDAPQGREKIFAGMNENARSSSHPPGTRLSRPLTSRVQWVRGSMLASSPPNGPS
jgi:malic enzyme